MKFVVPAKAGSIRVPEKNFRTFCDGKSLLDITLTKLLEIASAEDIFVSCELESKREIVEASGVNFVLRDAALCDNDIPFHVWFNKTIDDVPGDDDIAWCQVTNPLFDEYCECLASWHEVRSEHDSLVAVYPIRKYLLDSDFKPRGFGFGKNHVKSQLLPLHYEMPFTISILKRDTIRNDGYHVGESPFWYQCKGMHVDIDSMAEYEFAAVLYRYYSERTHRERLCD